MTVYDALYAVGGPTPFARAADSYVVRAGERIELDAAALWDGDGLHGDLPLQPRDQVVVPAAEVFVTVLGEVNRPGVIPFQHGLTVSDYLLRAGGPTREADLGLVHFVGGLDPVADGVDGGGGVVEQADDGGDALDAFQQAQDHLAFE